MSKVEITNMCMVYDRETGKVVVQDRKKSWQGIAFPGGHLEDGESLIDSTIREIKEETGLTISDLEFCGILHYFHDVKLERYMVFCYKTSVFQGELLEETEEGQVFWVDFDQLPTLPLAPGFEHRLHLFSENRKYSEGFGTWNETTRSGLTWK